MTLAGEGYNQGILNPGFIAEYYNALHPPVGSKWNAILDAYEAAGSPLSQPFFVPGIFSGPVAPQVTALETVGYFNQGDNLSSGSSPPYPGPVALSAVWQFDPNAHTYTGYAPDANGNLNVTVNHAVLDAFDYFVLAAITVATGGVVGEVAAGAGAAVGAAGAATDAGSADAIGSQMVADGVGLPSGSTVGLGTTVDTTVDTGIVGDSSGLTSTITTSDSSGLTSTITSSDIPLPDVPSNPLLDVGNITPSIPELPSITGVDAFAGSSLLPTLNQASSIAGVLGKLISAVTAPKAPTTVPLGANGHPLTVTGGGLTATGGGLTGGSIGIIVAVIALVALTRKN